MRLGPVIWASCVLQRGGSEYGGEMTLDLYHMSQSFGRSSAFPPACAVCSFPGFEKSCIILVTQLLDFSVLSILFWSLTKTNSGYNNKNFNDWVFFRSSNISSRDCSLNTLLVLGWTSFFLQN
ncbi:hypothetical protein ILYODFUR_001860 [Ilyodon furcidens]|uniref:Uncharacterized protein n=1 Tax=Ilyodon furcidens TaxID=33524 RepID=A0ABV0UZK8_9TELE